MRVPAIIARNFRLKAASLGLAVVTWGIVVYAANPPDSKTVSVAVPQDSVPTPFVLARPIAPLAVRIIGTREHIAAFDVGSLTVHVNWRALSAAGVQDLPVSIANADHDVNLDSVPATVSADVDIFDSTNLTVQASIPKPPPAGYIPSTPELSPAAVTVSGARRRLDGLRAVIELDMSNFKTNFDRTVGVTLLDKDGKKVEDLGVSPPSVQVHVTVTPQRTSRASAVLPHVSGTVAAGHEIGAVIVLDSPTVVLMGTEEVLNTLDSVSTATINVNGLTSDAVVEVRVLTPAGVTATPDTVRVRIVVVALPPAPTPSPSPSPSPAATP